MHKHTEEYTKIHRTHNDEISLLHAPTRKITKTNHVNTEEMISGKYLEKNKKILFKPQLALERYLSDNEDQFTKTKTNENVL